MYSGRESVETRLKDIQRKLSRGKDDLVAAVYRVLRTRIGEAKTEKLMSLPEEVHKEELSGFHDAMPEDTFRTPIQPFRDVLEEIHKEVLSSFHDAMLKTTLGHQPSYLKGSW